MVLWLPNWAWHFQTLAQSTLHTPCDAPGAPSWKLDPEDGTFTGLRSVSETSAAGALEETALVGFPNVWEVQKPLFPIETSSKEP